MKEFYTDGACSGNPGAGGWAVVVTRDGNILKQWGGYNPTTTNNRMELTAAVAALRALKPQEPAVIHTDSNYLRHGITEWLPRWKQKGWKTASKKPVKNKDLWEKLDQLNHAGIQWRYVAGHSGNPFNDLCDKIAKQYIKRYTN